MSSSQEDRPRGKNVRSSDEQSSSSPKKKTRPTDDVQEEKELIHEFISSSTKVEKSSTKNGVAGSNQLDNLYASVLPSSDYYERSYMHRDVLTHLVVTSSAFLITGSQDGHLKFWKILTADYLKQKQTAAAAALHQTSASKSADEKDPNVNLLSSGPIEFVKHFRAHLGPIVSLCVNESGTLLCSACGDRTVKMFDVLSFDMITMVKLDFIPLICSFVHSSRQPLATLSISDSQSPVIYLYDGKTLNIKDPIAVLSRLGHSSPVHLIGYSPKYDLAISCDPSSMINYWSPSNLQSLPSEVLFSSKLDTDLFELMKKKIVPLSLEISPTGEFFAILGRSTTERKLFLFDTLKGKIVKIFDEHLEVYKELHQRLQAKEDKGQINLLNNVEYSRRLTIEKDLEKNEFFYSLINLQFDVTGTFLFYSTLYGIKMLNLRTNAIRHFFGTTENARFIRLALYQSHRSATSTLETINPTILFTTAYKKNRFYLFTRNNPQGLSLSSLYSSLSTLVSL